MSPPLRPKMILNQRCGAYSSPTSECRMRRSALRPRRPIYGARALATGSQYIKKKKKIITFLRFCYFNRYILKNKKKFQRSPSRTNDPVLGLLKHIETIKTTKTTEQRTVSVYLEKIPSICSGNLSSTTLSSSLVDILSHSPPLR